MKHIEKIEKEIEDCDFYLHSELAVDLVKPENIDLIDKSKLKSFLCQSHTSFIQDLIQRVERERKPTDLDDFDIRTKTLCVGFNVALDRIISLIKEL
jgi:hypothetical protein